MQDILFIFNEEAVKNQSVVKCEIIEHKKRNVDIQNAIFPCL